MQQMWLIKQEEKLGQDGKDITQASTGKKDTSEIILLVMKKKYMNQEWKWKRKCERQWSKQHKMKEMVENNSKVKQLIMKQE